MRVAIRNTAVSVPKETAAGLLAAGGQRAVTVTSLTRQRRAITLKVFSASGETGRRPFDLVMEATAGLQRRSVVVPPTLPLPLGPCLECLVSPELRPERGHYEVPRTLLSEQAYIRELSVCH